MLVLADYKQAAERALVIITDELIGIVSRILGRNVILGEFGLRHLGEAGW
jgi:hypothetical protein